MSVLLVDDEPGIRDGLAAWLRLKGVEVQTAASVREALENLEGNSLIVTDWRLGDGEALPILDRSSSPVIVMSGHPGDVPEHTAIAEVLRKPVSPPGLLEQIRENLPVRDAAPTLELERLPRDVQERLNVFRQLTKSFAVRDEGVYLSFVGRMASPHALEVLRGLGGDLQLDDDEVVLRLRRDGAPDGAVTVAPAAAWPERPCAVDFHNSDIALDDTLDLLERAVSRTESGCPTWFINVPPDVALCLEALGHVDQMPKKSMAAPRLPAVLDELWS